jgi:4-amino-4-deoxy-L-arabinose transferase-like glycosyltransferase
LQPATRNFLALFCGSLLFHLAGTSLLPLVDRDEPRFAEASREMIERRDYVVPYFNNRYRFDKPPLTYWAQIASFRLFGETAFAARFPSAVAGALTAIVIFAWGRRLNLARAGFWAAIVFTLSPQTFIHAKAAVADMWLVLFMTLAHWAGYELLRDRFGGTWRSAALPPNGLRCWWWIFYISLALAFLTKGPIGWMPLGTVIITQLCRPVSYFGRRFLFVRGMLSVLAIVALWGLPALLRTHGEFFAIGLGRHVVGRSFGAMQGHGGNALGVLAWLPFYFVTVFASFAPWSIKLPWLTRRLWRERDTLDLYLIAGVAVVFGIFTIVRTKLPHYVLPAFPLLALLLVRHWLRSETDERIVRRWAAITAAVMVALALVGSRLFAPYFPAAALFKQAEPYLQSEMDFAAYDYDAASLVWTFRSRVRGFLHYNRKKSRDTGTLQPDQIPAFLAKPGPHFAVLPTELAERLYPGLPSGYRKFSVVGIDIAKVGIRFNPAKGKLEWKGWVNLTLILKNT